MNRIAAWLWPAIVDHGSAKRASMYGYVASFLLSVIFFMTGFLAVYTLQQDGPNHRLDFIDAFVFMIIGWMIKGGSRGWAIAGLVLCAFEFWQRFSFVALPAWLLLLLLFINSVRGSRGMQRFPAPVPTPPAS